jgi:hypothetical protein
MLSHQQTPGTKRKPGTETGDKAFQEATFQKRNATTDTK